VNDQQAFDVCKQFACETVSVLQANISEEHRNLGNAPPQLEGVQDIIPVLLPPLADRRSVHFPDVEYFRVIWACVCVQTLILNPTWVAWTVEPTPTNPYDHRSF
jgi:hypothetical protein